MRCPAAMAGLALAAVMALGALPAAAQQAGAGGQSLEDLRYRLGILDAELADLRARLGTVAPERAGPGRAGGDALLRLDRLEAELRRLTGMIEEIGFRQKRMAEDAGRRFADIEFRLTELEGGDVGAIGAPAPLGGTEEPARAPEVAAPAGGETPEISVSEREDLEFAIADIKQGRFDQGEDRLRAFLETYPGSPRIGEARFWLGRSHFVRGAFRDAARSHLAGYNADRQGPMAGDNLLQLGVTLGRLGQRREACLTLREVATQFPGQRELVNAADAERDSLAC